MSQRSWYVLCDGDLTGPYTESELVRDILSGKRHLQELVWSTETSIWKRLRDFPRFQQLSVKDAMLFQSSPRRALDAQVYVDQRDGTICFSCANISRTGLKLVNTSSLAVGQILSMVIRGKVFPEPLQARGIVVRVDHEESPVAGVHFLGMQGRHSQLIERFVNQA